MIDLTNPDAWNWTKDLIKENLVKEGRAGGWMHDFGEYLPFDAVLYDGSDPVMYHNKYPDDWARVVNEALSEVEGGEDIVYFMRAGSGTSPKSTRLYWLGDQLVTWDANDGLQSAMIGMINAGASGFTLAHSDIGGYTSVVNKHVAAMNFTRTKELLWRWIEMSTFCDVIMRSHPSSAPDDNYQIYDEDDSILFMKKFVDLHVRMADYKIALMQEASTKGSPVVRSMLLHFPHDARARVEHSQFMLGPNILMAPVFEAGKDSRDVYLAGPATWKHMWSGEEFEVGSEGLYLMDFSAPLGQPAVFTRDTDEFTISDIFLEQYSTIKHPTYQTRATDSIV